MRTGGELEMPPGRYDQGIARPHRHRHRVTRVATRRTSPDAPAALQHVPELLDTAMPDRSGALPGIQSHFTERRTLCGLCCSEQQPYFRPIRGQGVVTAASATHRRALAISAHTLSSYQGFHSTRSEKTSWPGIHSLL